MLVVLIYFYSFIHLRLIQGSADASLTVADETYQEVT